MRGAARAPEADTTTLGDAENVQQRKNCHSKLKKDQQMIESKSEYVKVRIEDRVLELTLDRPPANAIDAPVSRAIGEIMLAFRDDPELRVAIITGGGEKFF
jgi:transcriptional antiterminator Rof (Rho-off)